MEFSILQKRISSQMKYTDDTSKKNKATCNTENFSGLLLEMMAKNILDLRPAFEDFVKDLKTVAEN